MAPEQSLGKTTAPFQKYIFHFLPGLPILLGIEIIFNKLTGRSIIPDSLQGLQNFSSNGLLGFTAFLLILILVLALVLFLGLIVDSIRHMIEEAFLVAKWTEYKIVRAISKKNFNTIKGLDRCWDLYEKVNESEYYYIEFYGNAALSLAFFWSAIIKNECPGHLSCLWGMWLLWMFVVFLLRPFWAPVFWKMQRPIIEEWEKWEKQTEENRGEQNQNTEENIWRCIEEKCESKKNKKGPPPPAAGMYPLANVGLAIKKDIHVGLEQDSYMS